MRAAGAAMVILLAAGCQKQQARPATGALPPSDAGARCVYFKDLRSFLPAHLPGFVQTRDEGSTGKYGNVSVSEAKRVFTQESLGRELSVRIVDTTMADDLAKAIRAAAEDASGRPPSDPTAPIILADTVGFVRWDPSRSEPSEAKAEATLLVGDRYVVAVSGQGFKGTDEIREIARELDLAGLAKLR